MFSEVKNIRELEKEAQKHFYFEFSLVFEKNFLNAKKIEQAVIKLSTNQGLK